MKIKLKYHLVQLFFIFTFISCIDFVESPYPVLNVKQIQIIPGLARATASSFVINDKAYITLGRSGGKDSNGLKDCWQFDIINSVWIRKSDFPGEARVGAIAEVVNGKAYVGFGFNSGKWVYGTEATIFSDLWMYNPENDTWLKETNFPNKTNNPPLNSCSSFAYKKWIYIFALSAQTYQSKEVWRYDTEEHTWEQVSDFPCAARTAAVSCTDGEHFYFGLGYNGYNLNDWWEYFPDADKWKERSSMPGPGRINAVAFSVNHRFFVSTGRFMGGSLTTNQFFNDILEYDAQKNVWYKRGTIPTIGRENAIAFVLQNKAFVGFGDTDEIRFNDLWSFEP